MANGLRKWVQEKWVDIGSKRKDGSFAPCGRSKGEKRKGYPKCVPLAKARAMSEGQRRSAVARKRAASNTGPKPQNPKTPKPLSFLLIIDLIQKSVLTAIACLLD